MAYFMTRVQLNGYPDEETYSKLHKAMKAKGFSRVITGGDGKHYHLPHGQYSRDASATAQQVLNDAWTVAGSYWSDVEVLVTEGLSTWRGLKPATAAEAQQT